MFHCLVLFLLLKYLGEVGNSVFHISQKKKDTGYTHKKLTWILVACGRFDLSLAQLHETLML